MLALVGGTFGSLKLIGVFLATTFVPQLYVSSLVRRLYHFTPHFASEVPKAGKKKKKGNGKGPKTFADEIADEQDYDKRTKT